MNAIVEPTTFHTNAEPDLSNGGSDAGAARISKAVAADAVADGGGRADVDHVIEIEPDIGAHDVAPAPDVVRAQAIGDIARPPEERKLGAAEIGIAPAIRRVVDRERIDDAPRAGVAGDRERRPTGPGMPATAPRTMSSRSSNLSRKESALPVGRCAQVSWTLAVRVSRRLGAGGEPVEGARDGAALADLAQRGERDAVAVFAVARAIFSPPVMLSVRAIGRARGDRSEILGQGRAVADEPPLTTDGAD